jgi:CTP synthase
VQFHPEYKSTVDNPHPFFIGFVKAALQYHPQHEALKAQKV